MQGGGLARNGQNSGALKAIATRRRRILALLAVSAVAAFVVGVASGTPGHPGPLRWVGTPRAGAAGSSQLLYGTVVNSSKHAVRLESKAIQVVDGNGRALQSMSAFDGGYIAAYAGPVNRIVVLRPGQREPLSVSWTGGDGASVRAGGSSLSIPH